MERKIMLVEFLSQWTVEEIEAYIWAQRNGSFNALTFLTEEEIKVIIERIKSESMVSYNETMVRVVNPSAQEYWKDRYLKESLTRFAQGITLTPSIFDTQRGFELYISKPITDGLSK